MQQHLMVHDRVRSVEDKRALRSAMKFYSELTEFSATTIGNDVDPDFAEKCPMLFHSFPDRFVWLRNCLYCTTWTKSKIFPGTDGSVILEVRMLQGSGKRNVGDMRIVFSKEGILEARSSIM